MKKNIAFSIVKPFNELLKTPETDKWCAILCSYRTENYEEFKELIRKMELFEDSIQSKSDELLAI